MAFAPDGTVLTTSLSPALGNFTGDGKIHKFARSGGPEISSANVGLALGAIDYDVEDNAIWGAVYQPILGAARLAKIDPVSGAVITGCDIPFVPGSTNGAGNDTIAVAKIGGVKVLLTDAGDGNLPATTLYAVKASACAGGALINPAGSDVTQYLLKRGGADVPRVTGVSFDGATGNLIAASIAADEGSTDIINLGSAPFTGGTAGPLSIPGIIYDIATDSSLLDDFNRADGTRYLGNLGPRWTGAVDGGTYRISANALKVQNSGYIYWNGTSFGPNQEAYVTFKQVSGVATKQTSCSRSRESRPTAGPAAAAAATTGRPSRCSTTPRRTACS